MFLELADEYKGTVVINFDNVSYFHQDFKYPEFTKVYFVDDTHISIREPYQNLAEKVCSLDSLRR